MKLMHKDNCKTLIEILSLGIFMLFTIILVGQNTPDETFGKNRIQYHDNFKYWWKYETPNFITYWYSQARKPAESVILLAEQDYNDIQNLLEHHISDKIQLIVFKDLTDFKQSNLGAEDIFVFEKGDTKVSGNRVFIYANGDHAHLKKQIRAGVARVHINQMLRGSTLQEYVQNTFQVSLPDWYVEGLVSYIGEPWNIETDNQLQIAINSGQYKDFEDFSQKESQLAGHAMWNYINNFYGQTALSNLLYIIRIRHKLDIGFKFVLGKSFEEVSEACYDFYKASYARENTLFSDPNFEKIKIKRKKKNNLEITDIKLNPDGTDLIYVTNEIGKYKVWYYNLKTKTQKKIDKGNFRNPFQEADYNYPQYFWSRDGQKIYNLHEHHDKLYLSQISADLSEKETVLVNPIFDRIFDMSEYASDTLVVSAMVKGNTDLYFYLTKTRQSYKITNDFYDDLDAEVFYDGTKKSILFSSNRKTLNSNQEKIDTILPSEQFDLFLIDPISKKIKQVTNTKYSNERFAVQHSLGEIQYISDENGIRNRWKMDLNREYKQMMMSSNKSNMVNFDLAGNQIIELLKTPYEDEIFVHKQSQEQEKEIVLTTLAKAKKMFFNGEKTIEKQIEPTEPKTKFVVKNQFQTIFDEEIPLPESITRGPKDLADKQFVIPEFVFKQKKSTRPTYKKKFSSTKMLAYRLAFGLTDFSFDVNNDQLFSELNSYAGFKRGFDYAPFGLLLKVESKDLFENYIVSGGGRIPLSFDGTEFFLAVEDRKKQLDRKISIYRKSQKERLDERFGGNVTTRNTTHMAIAQVKYPLSIFSSFNLSGTLRFDKTIILPENILTSEIPDIDQQRIGLKFEYIFDNTFETHTNILNGTRAKVYVEVVNRFKFDVDPWDFDLSQAFMTVVGFDARKYVRIDKHSIFAFRLSGATSFGSEKILHYLGGVRNWLNPKYNDVTPFPDSEDFAYQNAAVDLRGFRQNIRNGASYVIGNAEFRLPLFNYFLRQPISSSFLRNFQLVAFADMGTAWHGKSPYSDDNPLNTVNLQNAVSEVKVKYYRDPFVYGYGVGARMQLLGYFVRADYAWGVETKLANDPLLYISLGYDF